MPVVTRTTHCNDCRWIESFTRSFTNSWLGIGLVTASLRMESRVYRRIFVGSWNNDLYFSSSCQNKVVTPPLLDSTLEKIQQQETSSRSDGLQALRSKF